ncbi:WcbI family polysaccharide biosynthesis putative acetyltransferase [Methylobacterium sp. Leaf113]|uniref:WcbI family polysaccharide biosynthesis putative acetyltransferase n=1 Tax=Methylobacterium sp. Leaf113 TaxID=1736259 RepID=UPI001FCD83B2|nr:WcbI family polysaccharide biosynthesis putative acetyltransferase [Methylobacterium sp. Leaf113]
MRSWAGAWRRAAPSVDPTRTGPRLAVLGNCQAEGVAQALQLLVPTARVALIPLGRLTRHYGTLDRLRTHLDAFDHVFTQFFPTGFVEGGNVHALAEGDPRVRLFPTILFPGYHPDMVHVGDVGALSAAHLVRSPVGPYHSAIILCAYLEGLSPADTVALFRDSTYAQLGYYEAWNEAAAYLLGGGRDMVFPLEADLARWSRRGCFMHVLNHPKLFVLADIARRLASEAGLAPVDVPVEDYLPDELAADVVWPLYPDLAARYGLPGTMVFKDKARGAAFPKLYDLPAFVAASFAIYRRHDPAALACTRVEAWRADPAVRAIFRA